MLFLGLFALSGCARNLDPRLAQKFQAAQTAFDQAAKPQDFVKVAAMYQEMIDDGAVSGAVFYNQGNAWMRAKQPGRAIAAYRQAAAISPPRSVSRGKFAVRLGTGRFGPSAGDRNTVVLAELAQLSGEILRRRRGGIADVLFCRNHALCIAAAFVAAACSGRRGDHGDY